MKKPKICTKCGAVRDEIKGRSSYCKKCSSAYMKDWYATRKERKLSELEIINLKKYRMISRAKGRAKERGTPFSIVIGDIDIPEKCPVFGTNLAMTNNVIGDDSPTLDCLVPSLGYVVGNVSVISCKANIMKSNGTSEDALKVYNWMKSKGL